MRDTSLRQHVGGPQRILVRVVEPDAGSLESATIDPETCWPPGKSWSKNPWSEPQGAQHSTAVVQGQQTFASSAWKQESEWW